MLEEYIENSQGMMWLSQTGAVGWTFDQFQFVVLRVTLHLISSLPPPQRYLSSHFFG
jgi:hypothetical protein